LPPTLDQTYDRILSTICKEDREYAIRILQWLTFSERPLTIREVAEVVAIDVERDPAFDRDEVLEDPLEVLNICSSLVTITDSVEETIALAHYSVKEYLVSDRIKQGPANRYSMQPAKCHNAITKSCLKYLLQLPHPFFKDDLQLAALAWYSADFWPSHLQETGNEMEATSRLAMELMSIKQPAYLTWVQLYRSSRYRMDLDFTLEPEDIAPPLYYASYLGTSLVAKLLREEGVDVNAQGGRYGTALGAASHAGSEPIVKLLLNAGANVNARAGDCVNALCVASMWGHEQIVETLLSAGAVVNTHCEYMGNALYSASMMGHGNVVKRLLDAGADVNAPGGYLGSALEAALGSCYSGVGKTLLEAGADIHSGTLETAIEFGNKNVVEILLKAGAQPSLDTLWMASVRKCKLHE
jgi:hypothetical protein